MGVALSYLILVPNSLRTAQELYSLSFSNARRQGTTLRQRENERGREMGGLT